MKSTLSLLLAVGLFLPGISSASEGALKTIWDTYQKDTDQVRRKLNTGNFSDNELRQFRFSWYNQLSSALTNSNKGDDYYPAFTAELEGLANELGDYVSSEKWIVASLLLHTNSPDWQFKWNSERGEVLRREFLSSHDTNLAIRAIASFNQASNYFDAAKLIAPAPCKKQLVINLTYSGELYYQMNDFNSAMNSYQAALAGSRLLSESEKEGMTGFDAELFASSILECAAKVSNSSAANDALNMLLQLSSPRIAPSYYAFEYAQANWSSDDALAVSFMRNWLKEHLEDTWTPFLMLEVANNLIDAGKPQLALDYYNVLFDKHTGDLKAADIKYGLVGKLKSNYAKLLLNASRAAFLVGDKTNSEKWKNEYLNITPKQNDAPRVNRIVTAPPNNNLMYPPPSESNWKALFLILIINVAMFMTFFVFRIKRK